MQQKNKFLSRWECLESPSRESFIEGKWYVIIFKRKKKEFLLADQVLKSFLTDENGPEECILVNNWA